MSLLGRVRENWRIVLLAVLVVGSTAALFAPAAGSEGPTNLQFGLELSGGTRVRAPLVGMTAEDVSVSPNRSFEVAGEVAGALEVGRSNVRIDTQEETVEVFADPAHGNVTRAEFAAALRSAGFDVSEGGVRMGVTDDTREQAVDVLNNKINRGGLSGGSATSVTTPTGDHFVLVEVPNANRSEVIDLIGDRGRVEIIAHFPTQRDNATVYRNVSLLSQDDLAQIGQARQGQGSEPPFVPVTLTEPAAQNFSSAMQTFGFTSDTATRGQGQCTWQSDHQDAGWCLFTVLDGEVVFAARMSTGLAGTIESGDFAKSPTFRMTATNFSDARELQLNLAAGALPTTLAIESSGTSFFLEPSLAQEFKLFSLVTGLVAMLAVSGVVFLRYGRPGVALPMLLTAGAEVYILLAFASAVGLPLDLSHIAGFIAVIGTGVDDLIIIADEIMQRGDISTSKVFQSRFRKAFWVIGAAAATTIIAMSPLAVLSLGDLQGFAIVTIVGVLIGVLITRPAYGDILRNVVLE